LAVSFNATGTSHGSSSINTNRFHELIYLWDFDDLASGTWRTTGKSRNHMTGPLGAHVFEPSSFPDCGGSCKRYTVNLTVRDALGNSDSVAKVITVYAPGDSVNAWGASGRSICISRSSNFSGCPTGAATETNSGTFNSILSSKISAGYRRVLFRGGDTWTMSGQYTVTANGPGLIGSFGSGKFTLHLNTASLDNGAIVVHGDNWRLQDVVFTGSAGHSVIQARQQVKNFLLQRASSPAGQYLRRIATMPINYLSGSSDEGIHRHVFYVDNSFAATNDPSHGGGANFYGAYWGLTILGNSLGGATKGHVTRITTGQDILISNNIYGPQGPNKHALQLRDAVNECSFCPGKPFCGRMTRYFLIQDNEFRCGGELGPCIEGTKATCASAGVIGQEDYIFERNLFKEASGGKANNAFIMLRDGPSRRIVIRNNIGDQTGWSWATGFMAMPGAKVYNNTCYRSDSNGDSKAVCVSPNGADECHNNLMYAPNWNGGALSWLHPSSGSCKNSSNNMDNSSGGGITSNPFVSSNPRQVADFTPRSGSPLVDSAKTLYGVHDDGLGNCRLDVAAKDVGAVERAVSESCAGVPAAAPPDPTPTPVPTRAPFAPTLE
jgi:hypothetical protein